MDYVADMRAALADGLLPDADSVGIGAVVALYASRSRPGAWHRCSYSPAHGFRCTCPGMLYHRHCWHVTDLGARLAGSTTGKLSQVADPIAA